MHLLKTGQPVKTKTGKRVSLEWHFLKGFYHLGTPVNIGCTSCMVRQNDLELTFK